MTANLGATYLIDQVGETDKRVMADVKKHLPIEFINRIDEIIIFVSQSALQMHQAYIAQLLISEHYHN